MKKAALLAAAALAAVALVPSGGAQSSRSVTLSVFRVFDGGNRVYRFRFSGSISSRAAGEYVSVMQQKCGYTFATAIAGAQTRAGGFWEVETSHAPRPELDTNTYFARWGSARSRPVAFRGRLWINAVKIGVGRYSVFVDVGSDALQDMSRRQVVLQRRFQGRWERVSVARLRVSSGTSYVASFRVRVPPGSTLRAVVPAKNARPCFNQTVSERFRS